MKNRFKQIRESYNLSQREFGERIGVSRDVISNIEYGRVAPKDLIVKQVCKEYNVNEEWLRTGNGSPYLTEPAEMRRVNEAAALFQSLRPEFQDYALEQIRKLLELQNGE